MERIELLVEAGLGRVRLEDYLCARFPALSKMYLRNVVNAGDCEVNGRHENIGYRLRAGDFVEIELDLTREHSMLPQEIPLDVIYEDSFLIVVNKPAGMLVHPSHREKNGTLLNAVVHHLNRHNNGTPIRPGLIHRLDKDTSGLIVIAKEPRAHRILCRHFQIKLVEKRYLALVDGIVGDDEGTITGAIGRNAEKKMWELHGEGKPSTTLFRVAERRASSTLLELEPVTGRTNQLRIHCASIGHPIVGDTARGGPPNETLCLHAASLAFRHPSSGELREFRAQAPEWAKKNGSGTRCGDQ